ncbi:ABC transporter permease [Dactylosporangium sp. CA-233914]|uniref:ABC transporter permease n=1 Tax=Dactylosporangium sp. CA-233914 TaxID=3239934 RepID=UPI003D8B5B91
MALWVVVTLVFFLARLGGDPAALLAPVDATPAQIDQVRRDLGLDQPVFIQYADYLRGLVTGDLGMSTSFRTDVLEIVGPAMVNTAELALVGFVIALVGGLVLGTLAGTRVNSRFDKGVRLVAVAGQSVPAFFLGMLLVLLFTVNLGLLPAFGSGDLKSIILPAVALAAFPLSAITRLTRSAVLEVAGRDQTMFERSKGVSPVVLLAHIVRNASLPVVTLSGVQLGAMFSSTIVVESLFAWPGVGQLAIQAINSRDFALIQGIVIVNTLVYVGLLFLVDLSYGWLDPRVRQSNSRNSSSKVTA